MKTEEKVLDPKLKPLYDKLVRLSKGHGYCDLTTEEICAKLVMDQCADQVPYSSFSIAKKLCALSKAGFIHIWRKQFKPYRCIVTKNNFDREQEIVETFEKSVGYKVRFFDAEV